jgi:ketosteroid isomerase-like protein
MKRLAILLALLAIAGTTVACNNQGGNRDQDIQLLKDNETQWNQDYVARDFDKLVTYYSNDAVLMAPGMPAIQGKDAIHNALKQMVADQAFSLKFQSTRWDVAKSSDLAYTQGSYTLTLTDPRTKKVVTDHGSFVTTYRRNAEGTWKAVADIATSSVPAGDMK